MAYVPVPKDLAAVKTKVLFNITKRQHICFGGGALIGIPLSFFLKGPVGLSASSVTLCMVPAMLPFFLMAIYEKRSAAGKDRPQHHPSAVPASQAAISMTR